MKRILLSIATMGMLTAAAAPNSAAVDYSFTASIKDGQLTVQHRILNRSKRTLCFFPDSMDIASAKLRGLEGKEITNIHNVGFIAGRQTVYFAAADGSAHLFSYAADVAEVFAPADAERARTLEFDFYGFDCNDLTSGRARVMPVARKTAKAAISRIER